MRKLCWAGSAFSAGVFLGMYLLPGRWQGILAVLLALAPLVTPGRRGRGWSVVRRLVLPFLALGLCRCCLHTLLVLEPAEALVGETRTVSARVLELPEIYDSSTAVEVRLTEAGLPRVKCRVSAYGEDWLDELRPGDEIRLELRFASASVLYGEETELYSARGVFLRGYCQSEVTVTGRCAAAWRYAPGLLRQAMSELCRAVFPEDVAAFQAALLAGDRTELNRDYPLYYALSRAGLMHVVAVSGMHVSFLAGLVWLLWPNRRRSALALLPLLLFFAAMMGFTPSVTRAVFMQLCFLAAPLARREGDAPTAMALVLSLLLLQNPTAARSASLQLSFAATVGILFLSGRILTYLRRRGAAAEGVPGRVLHALQGVASVSLGALAFTVPLTALHFGYVSVVSPLSNLLCLWMVSLLFTLGYAALLAGALFLPAGMLLGSALAWGGRYIFAVSAFLSRLPCAAVYTENPVFIVWLALVYLLFLLWFVRRREGPGALSPLCLSLLSLCAAFFLVRLAWNAGFRTTVLDVGQGECVLCESGGEAVMVDCGGMGTLDRAGETAGYYLLSRCRTRLDALILTHLHEDHANGVPRLLALARVDRLYLPASDTDEDGLLPEILRGAERAGTEVLFLERDEVLTGERLRVALTAPARGYLGENDNGLIVRVSAGENDVVITGDAGASLERRYAAANRELDGEVLVVGHHGSVTSSDAYFLRTLRFEIAVVSVGYNTYGHPREEVLERLEEYGAVVRRTDEEGHVTILLREGP